MRLHPLPAGAHRAALVAIVVLAAAPGAGLAQEDPAAAERAAQTRELEALRSDVEAGEARQEALAEEIAALRNDRAQLNQRLIDIAAEVQESEAALTGTEERLAGIAERQAAVRGSLDDRRAQLGELLASLQRMGRQPPPAVLVSPEDALTAVRSAMLLGAVFPEVRRETEALAGDLEELKSLEAEAAAGRDRLVARTRELEQQRQELAALTEAKRASIEEGESALEATRARVAALARKAEDVESLIAGLDPRAEPSPGKAGRADRTLSPDEAREAMADAARLAPAMPFAQAVGLLPMPVSGPVVRGFGERDSYGETAQGLTVATRSAAQVVSPADGHVAFAGPFRSYGQLLIVDAGDGYHVLLAGMQKIGVDVGQFVLAGEPVGAMGELRLASAAETSVGTRQPVLYIEFRKDGRSIDPAPWWSDGGTGVGG